MTSTRTHRKTRAKARLLVRLALLIPLCAGMGCGGDRQPLNLVLIGVDTLRPDHLGCYGYEHRTSPNIDEFAKRGVLFENVVSPSPWTLPSFATVFTSLYPRQHGATGSRTPMRESFPTLASMLKTEGYATGAIINAPYLKARFGIDRGFDFYYLTPPEGRGADGTTEHALDWIDGTSDQPFFIFVHYFDPHIPYAPPAPYDTLFYPDYTGDIKRSYNPKGLPMFRTRNFIQMESLSSDDWNHIRALYDGEIAFTDLGVGGLLEGLKDRGLDRNTLIVFLSDHGEEFFEHHGFEHGHTLFDELIKVPLIFSLPGTLPRGERISHQVRLVDVEPTILDLLGMTPWEGSEGVSLVPFIRGRGKLADAESPLLPPEIAFSEALLYGQQKRSVTAYPWKLIYNLMSGEISFFNLAEDPGEHHDIADLPSQSRPLLEDALYRTMFGMSNTWYVEMAGGEEEHRFDFNISCKLGRGLDLHKVIDSQGNILSTDSLGLANISRTRISIQNLTVKEPLTLVLQPHKGRASIQFDLIIDGEPAVQQTFIGETLARPVTVPFTEQPSKEGPEQKGRPTSRPEPPYYLVWLSKTEFEGRTDIELDEETKKELRSLGYIQ